MASRPFARPFVAAVCLLAVAAVARAQNPAPPAAADRMLGTWQGVLSSGAFRERLAIVVSRDSGGALAGIMKSLDQGTQAPASVTVHGDTLSFTIGRDRVAYVGVATAGADSLRGTLTQNGRAFSLTLGRAATATDIARRPQDPRPPYPYRTEDVTVPSVDGVRLACTALTPDGPGPFPAVVLVTGSGPQDRDETILGHHPFLVIADYLGRHGIASLRCDDRGFARSTGTFGTATSADFAADAEAEVHFLQRIPSIAPNRVGIIGHSEGGLIGPMVAARSRDVAFLVLLAGPGIPGDSLSLLQLHALAGATLPAAQLDAMAAINRRLYAAVTGSRDSADAVARLNAAKGAILASTPDGQRAAMGVRLDQTIPTLTAPWMRYFLRYDSRIALRSVHVPVLALGGSLDEQVPARENLAGIADALKMAGNTDFQTIELPGLNHLFQTATTGAPAEYATIQETIAPRVLELMTSWINQRFARR